MCKTRHKGFGTERVRLGTFRGFGTGLRASRVSHFLKNLKKVSFFYSKRAPSLPKTDVLHEKCVFFYSKRPPSPAKNWNFALKMTKSFQKEHPAPKKLKFCLVFCLLKNTSQPHKKLKFCMKKWQKINKKVPPKKYPAPQTTEVLHEKLKTVLQ